MISKSKLNSLVLSCSDWPNLFDVKFAEHLSEGALILDCVREAVDDGYVFHIFCPFYVNQAAIEASLVFLGETRDQLDANFESFCKGTKITVSSPSSNLAMQLGGKSYDIKHSDIERTMFSGKNAAILITNGDNQEQIEQWISYFKEHQNLQSIVVFERTKPNETPLEINIDEVDGQHLQIETAFGKLEPSAREVYMAPDAPGKERMDIPNVDIWRSELHNNMLLEIARLRFLNDARAVLHLSPSDLIAPNSVSIFDQAVKSSIGYIQLFGVRCFPWRVRKKDKVTFGDHCVVKFEDNDKNKGWCIVPSGPRSDAVWNIFRAGKIPTEPEFIETYWRMMGMRHEDPKDSNPNLAPKSGLVLDDALLNFVTETFGGNPVLPPERKKVKSKSAIDSGRRLIVTTMKNEGPFLLEWIAYHKAIGFDDFVVFTNDCTDGTDKFFDLLHSKGIVEHRDNPYRQLKMKPQHAALADVKKSKLFKAADWVVCMDVDEYVNIHVGDGTLDDLFKAVGDANMISMTWRLIGNSDVVDFVDAPIIEQFNCAAHDVTRFPHQAWGVKTLYRQLDLFKKMGVHRPKGLKPEHIDDIKWVNGSGVRLPDTFYRTAWRTGTATVGYDMVTLNHYAVRSMESFLVKRDRGRVNHVDRDQGLHYWFRMNHNVIEDNSIKRMIPKMREEMDKLMADPEIAAFHTSCVAAHRAKIGELLETEAYQDFFALINSDRLRELSKFTNKFGMNVYEVGQHVITDKALEDLRTNTIEYFNVRDDGTMF